MLHLIRKPVVTEKSNKVNALHKHYVFEVEKNATKFQIAKSVEAMFQVKVEQVRTVIVKGKSKRRMTRRGVMNGRTRDKKKAYIRLQPGYTIDVVSGEGEKE